jgi:hypothetical protein
LAAARRIGLKPSATNFIYQIWRAGTDPSLQYRPLHWPSGASPGPFFLALVAPKELSSILRQRLKLLQAIREFSALLLLMSRESLDPFK